EPCTNSAARASPPRMSITTLVSSTRLSPLIAKALLRGKRVLFQLPLAEMLARIKTLLWFWFYPLYQSPQAGFWSSFIHVGHHSSKIRSREWRAASACSLSDQGLATRHSRLDTYPLITSNPVYGLSATGTRIPSGV